MLKKTIRTLAIMLLTAAAARAATNRYAEIRQTLQPDTTSYGIFLGSGTVNYLNVSTITATKATITSATINGGTITSTNLAGTITDTSTTTHSGGQTFSSMTVTSANIAGQTVTASTTTRLNVTTAMDLGSVRVTNAGAATAAADVPKYNQIGILQVISSTGIAGDFATPNTAFQNTGITLTITPKTTSSKIFLLATFEVAISTSDGARFTFYKNGVNLGGSLGLITAQNTALTGTNVLVIPVPMSYPDSPATTSATTYTVYMLSVGGTNSQTLHGGSTRPPQFSAFEINGL